MPKPPKQTSGSLLKGWARIARYLGQRVATTQHWAKTGMPVRRQGRFVVAEPDDLNGWLGKESGLTQPAHVAQSGEGDLTADLTLGLKAVRSAKPKHKRAA